MKKFFYLILSFISISWAWGNSDYEEDRKALLKRTGCYLVDYNFTEIESLKSDYIRSKEVYDANSRQSVFEWIVPIEKSDKELRLQHLLFTKDLQKGEIKVLMKHEAEDWSFEAPFLFEFISAGSWIPKDLQTNSNSWNRKVANLDDGLRYQCSAPWNHTTYNPEWSCSNFAPIPGRETRDMKRKDYQALNRNTRIVVYDNAWVEKEDNVKVIIERNGAHTPLAREVGRNWYIRQPDSTCALAQSYYEDHKAYWLLLMKVWEEYLSQKTPFLEYSKVEGQSRYESLEDVEEKNYIDLKTHPENAENIKTQIRSVIEKYRKK